MVDEFFSLMHKDDIQLWDYGLLSITVPHYCHLRGKDIQLPDQHNRDGIKLLIKEVAVETLCGIDLLLVSEIDLSVTSIVPNVSSTDSKMAEKVNLYRLF